MDGFTVRIENSLLAEALESLDGKKRDVILRYYFLGFDDTEISYICKVAMEDERKDYLKALSRQCKRETLFCDMDDYTVNLFSSEDTYPSHFHTFEMDGFTVRIENSLLAEALESLDGKKRDVILRYYFLGFDDTEISKILEVNRSTIQRRRHAGLEFIKKFMEDEA
jgi:RNA polymerase sigma factor (sigma-70 family)